MTYWEKTDSLPNVWLLQTEPLCYWSLNFTMDYIINVHTIWLARQSQIRTALAVVLFFHQGKTQVPPPKNPTHTYSGAHTHTHTNALNFQFVFLLAKLVTGNTGNTKYKNFQASVSSWGQLEAVVNQCSWT